MQISPTPTQENLGGKGWHLHLLSSFCPVPEFFIIKFDSANEIKDKKIQAQIINTFTEKNFSLVSVRSSATVEDGAESSFAGIFESVLNVNENNLINAITQVLNSVQDVRVKEYSKLKKIDYSKIEMRVIVQRMIASDTSGVCFTKLPNSMNAITIEACLGLGEALVSGKVTPDNYVINRETLKIEKCSTAHQKTMLGKLGYTQTPFFKAGAQKLTNAEIQELAKTSLKIEKRLNFQAADIEWAYENGKFYILQARAVTGLIETSLQPNINDYELTFEVTGLGFLFADMLTDSFNYMRPLFTIHKGEFKQYFHRGAMEEAGKQGLLWLNSKDGFNEYEKNFKEFHSQNFETLKRIAANNLTKQSIKRFMNIANMFHTCYSKMNTQFTNHITPKALENKGSDLGRNLEKLSAFKDIAREWINQILINDNCHLNILLQNISKKFEVSPEDLNYYKSAELCNLFDNKKISMEELQLRHNAIVFLNGSQTEYIVGDCAQQLITETEQLPHFGSSIKGQVANSAGLKQIEGTVCIINVDYANLDAMHAEIERMGKDEILVAKFTAPELLSACTKAKAIITDLGGILSHAAIVSRELKIPCIVGTRNASKQLQSGTRIKLDLLTGEILKL